MNAVDFIGDIHGYASKLEALLQVLGYQKLGGAYRHSERTAIFVGDFIDRGPEIPQTIELVRRMRDAGSALAVMGNHEYNALCYHTPGPNGYLRPHSKKNTHQLSATLHQFGGRKQALSDALNWFQSLPLYLETERFRVVHACWEQASIDFLKTHSLEGILTDELLQESADKSTPLSQAVNMTCKGKESQLPAGLSYSDKDGHVRTQIRQKWWLNPEGRSFKEMSVAEDIKMEDMAFQAEDKSYYKENEKPVFLGHYWLQGVPSLLKPNVCCVDYSVAKGGILCCYRYEGEDILKNESFVFV